MWYNHLGGVPRERSRIETQYRSYTTNVSSNTYTIVTGELTRDENHIIRDEYYRAADKSGRLNGTFYDTGGPFYNEKASYWDDGRVYRGQVLSSGGSLLASFVGPQLPLINNSTDFRTSDYWLPVSRDYSDEELDAFGSTAISRCAPTNPHVSVFNMVGELYRDGLPRVPGLTTLRDRNVGGEYLNYEFGLKPLLSDIRKLHMSLTESEKILKQYVRDAGKLIRRRYEEPPTIESSTLVEEGGIYAGRPSLNTRLYGGTMSGARRITVETTTVKRWFSGAFTYHAVAPDKLVGSMISRIQEYNHLLGVLPTPEAIWNLTPWSWAADWVTNMGDLMNNLSMFLTDDLVIPYGYVMEHTLRTKDLNVSGYSIVGAGPVNSNQRFVSETKVRRRATPFGFGLDVGQFSDRQWAILAALGLSQGRGVAR